MKRIAMAALVLLSVFQVEAARRVLPIAAHQPGANQTLWTTDLNLSNRGAGADDVILRFHPASGMVERTVRLAAGESRLLEDAVNPASFGVSNSAGWFGQLEILSSGEVEASARIFTTKEGGGTFGSTHRSVDPSSLTDHGFLPGLRASTRFRTNVAAANVTAAPQVVQLVVRREDGTVATTIPVGVAPLSTTQVTLNGRVPDSDSSYSVEWSSTGKAYVAASVIDNLTNDPTSIGGVAVGRNSLFFPIVSRAPGANDTFWTTALSVTTESGTAGLVELKYRGGDGTANNRTVSLPARGALQIDDVLNFLGVTSGSGQLTVESTIPIVGVVRIAQTEPSGATYGSAVLPQDDSISSTDSHIRGVRRDDRFRVNVAVSNDHAAESRGEIRFYDDRGQRIESRPFAVGAGKTIQYPVNLTSVAVSSGEIEVEVENGIAVTILVSNIDNRSGDTVIAEVEQETERQQEIEMVVTPRTGAVGSAISFSVTTIGVTVTSVSWDFGDNSTATGANVTHAFSSPGEFDVTATLTLLGGAILRKQEDVTILGSGTSPAGGLDFTWAPAAPQAGQSVTFTASLGGAAAAGSSLKWQFPGQIVLKGNPVSFSFAANGSHEVELELEREGQPTLRVDKIVIVGTGGGGGGGGAGATAMSIAWQPTSPAIGQTVTFSASFTGVPRPGAFVKWKVGAVEKIGNPVTYTFSTAGSFEVQAELEQEGLVTIRATAVINVGGGGGGGGGGTGAAGIDFTWAPASPRAGQQVSFTATFTGDPLAGSTVKWRFPDDSRPVGNPMSYTFPSAGVYKVRAQLEQPGRLSIEMEKNVSVSAP